MPYFMVSNYGGIMRDVGQLIMEVGVTKLYIRVFSFLKGEKNRQRDHCVRCFHVSAEGMRLGRRTTQ